MVRKWIPLTWLLIVCLGGSCLAARKPQQSVISGQVRAATSDERGNVLSVEIMVGEGDEDPYLVSDQGNGRELKKLVGQWVVVVGQVVEDDLGWKTIIVEKYRLMDEFPER